jgi:hypothetical protein
LEAKGDLERLLKEAKAIVDWLDFF